MVVSEGGDQADVEAGEVGAGEDEDGGAAREGEYCQYFEYFGEGGACDEWFGEFVRFLGKGG